MENPISKDICQTCAACCKNYPFVELTNKEIKLLAEATGLPLEVFTISKRKAVAEYFLQFQDNGDCFFLNEENGKYSCAVYAARPGICSRYPSNLKQQAACDLSSGKSEE